MKKQLLPIGYWNSKYYGEDRFIWPQELVGNHTDLGLATYLSKGMSAIAWKGYSGCRICKKLLGTCCLTDGVYIWPEKLEHYILEHKVVLPIEFFEYAKKNKWEIKKTNYDGDYRGKINWNYWIDWCEKNRNPDAEPQFNFEECDVPKETGRGELTHEILMQMFYSIESLDCIVDTLMMDSRDIVNDKGGYEKENVKENYYCADIIRGSPLIVVVGRDKIASSALVFENNEPVILCERKESMYGDCNIPTKWCPNLKNYVATKNI